MTPETYWLSIGILFIIIEVLSGGLWIVFFGIGAILTAAIILTGLTETLNSQIAVFLLSSGLALGLLRKPFRKRLYRKSDPATFENSLGKRVSVSETIPEGGSGRVSHQGSTWDAEAEDGGAIPADSQVEIVREEGTRLFVRKLEQ